jgi:hypothetical protein
VQHRDAAEQSGEHATGGADLYRAAPAQPPCQRTHRQRCHPQTEHEDADRQRRQPLVRRQHGADDAGGRDQDRVVAAGERLRHRQHQRIAPRQAIAREAVRLCFGERRHPHAPKRDERRRVFLPSRGVGDAPVPRDAELLGRMKLQARSRASSQGKRPRPAIEGARISSFTQADLNSPRCAN